MLYCLILICLVGSAYAFAITGKTTSSLDGSNVSGVNITLFDFNSGSYINSTITDVNGDFSFSVPTAVKYLLNATKVSWYFQTREANATSYVPMVLGKSPSLNVSGYVKDIDGNPISGASVVAAGAITTTSFTSPSGFYLIELWNGTYTFKASKDLYYDNATVPTVLITNAQVNFTLARMPTNGTVRGYVYDCDNSSYPIAGAAVFLIPGGAPVFTTSNGSYELIKEGAQYNISAVKPTYNQGFIYNIQIINGQTLSNISFCLSKSSPFTCTNKDNDGYWAGSSNCPVPLDCNDDVYSIHPGAVEVCANNIDDDCDGLKDEGCIGPVSDCGNGVCNATQGESCSTCSADCGGCGGGGGGGGGGGSGHSGKTYTVDANACIYEPILEEKDVVKFSYLGVDHEFTVMNVDTFGVKFNLDKTTVMTLPLKGYKNFNFDGDMKNDLRVSVEQMPSREKAVIRFNFIASCRNNATVVKTNTTFPKPVVDPDLNPIADDLPDDSSGDGSDDGTIVAPVTPPAPPKKDEKVLSGRVDSQLNLMKADLVVGILIIFGIILLGLVIYWFLVYRHSSDRSEDKSRV